MRRLTFHARGGLLDLAALIAGAVLTLAYAPFGWFPLAYLAPALLLLLWFRGTPRRALWRGWLFGLGLFGGGVHWVYYSLHDFGGAAPLFAAAATFMLVAYLALFPALQGWLLRRLCPRLNATAALLWFPLIWVLAEQAREYLLTGFPWLRLGYSQIDSPLSGIAPLFGVAGVGLATAVVSGAVALLAAGPAAARRAALAGLGLALLLGVVGGRVPWVEAEGEPVTVALVQGNIPQSLKWSPEWQRESLARYRDLTLAAAPAVLVIWPETALPGLLHDLSAFTDPLAELLASRGSTVLTGVPSYDPTSGRIHNSVAELGAGGGLYHKRHLVPFGEFLPLRGLLEFFNSYVEIPMSDFGSGAADQAPLTVAGQVLGVSICYEIIFGEQIRQALPDAGILVNVSNDAWFGDSAAPYQHLEMARMRALELGRPILRATNDGVTAVIGADGRIRERLARSEPGVLSAEIRSMTGLTPYAGHGILGVLGVLALMLAVAMWGRRGGHADQPDSSSATRP